MMAPQQNRVLAVALLLAGFFLLTMVDATSKVLTERYHALEIGFGRAVFQMLPLLGFIAEHLGIRWSFGIALPLIVISLLVSHRLGTSGKT